MKIIHALLIKSKNKKGRNTGNRGCQREIIFAMPGKIADEYDRDICKRRYLAENTCAPKAQPGYCSTLCKEYRLIPCRRSDSVHCTMGGNLVTTLSKKFLCSLSSDLKAYRERCCCVKNTISRYRKRRTLFTE